MMRIMLLAWRYIAYYKIVTLILLVSITATLYLPFTINILIGRMENQLFTRAETTPLIIGAKGSRFDLTLNTLYFEAKTPYIITMKENDIVLNSGLATPVPLHVRFKAQGYPLVGTSFEYFDFRQLKIAVGEMLSTLGDCVVGANIASDLGLKPGDRLMSDPENIFDISGNYPLNMKVVGILAPSQSPDDNAVFVDLKTVWIIEGIGHGHQELSLIHDSTVLLQQSDTQIVANAALPQYTEITSDNIASFHFHAEQSKMPLTAVIAIPNDNKSRVLLEGRFSSDTVKSQILRPKKVVDDIMAMVLKIKQIFDAGMVLIAIITGLFLALVILLSSRLRKNEMHTMFKLGCSKLTIFWLQFAGVVLIIVASIIGAVILALISLPLATDMIKKLMT